MEAEEDGAPTVYDKLGTLCQEIEGQIKTVAGGSTPEIEKSLEWMHNESYKESSPEAEYAIRLFMKYVDEANAAKLRAAASGPNEQTEYDGVSFTEDIPPYM